MERIIIYSRVRESRVNNGFGSMFAGRDIYYFIFSRSGFTTGLTEEAEKNGRLTLVGPDDLFRV